MKKVCKICQLELDTALFAKVKKFGKAYLNPYCHDCRKQKATEARRAKGIMPKGSGQKQGIPEKKKCSRCGIEKDKKDFYTVKTKHNLYLRSYCRQCDKEKHEEYARQKGVIPMHCRPIDQLPKTKVCTKCKKEKEQHEFRIRKVLGKLGMGYYLSPPCLKCEAKQQRERVRQQRKTAEGREYHNRRAREYNRKHREMMIAKAKAYRESEQGKKTRKKYIEKNKWKIAEQEAITKRRYHEKHCSEITDKYAIARLKNDGVKEEEITPEMIEIKKTEIVIFRLKMKINEMPIGVLRTCSCCGEEKDLSWFWKKSKNSEERLFQCKECMSFKSKKNKYKKYVEQHCNAETTPV